jgi:N-acetylglucosamine kinase-like BadF-type ATPase
MTILLADSGSTKTEWKLIRDGSSGESFFSGGINPYFLNEDEIFRLLVTELSHFSGKLFDSVYFYGTGCNSDSKNSVVKSAIERFLSSGKTFIGSDLLGAAHALCQNEPGIACIMGTGSNSCYYDGKEIRANVSPLGYILGDEGGGAVLGRKLVSAVLKRQVPEEIRQLFLDTYRLSPQEILERVYMKPFPNRFLGQFARFYSSNINVPELQDILRTSFYEFIIRNVLQYPEAMKLPVHFTGSVAFNFRAFVTEALEKYGLKAGKFSHTPMEDLVAYHINLLA